MKTFFRKSIFCLSFIVCCINGYGQEIIEENLFIITLVYDESWPSSDYSRVITINGRTIDLEFHYWDLDYFYATINEEPSYFQFYRTPCTLQCTYIRGKIGYDIDCINNGYYNGVRFGIRGPVLIKNVAFIDDNYNVLPSDYACPDKKIRLELENLTDGSYIIECRNENGDWVEVKDVIGNHNNYYIDLTYDDLLWPGLDPTKKMFFRTRADFPVTSTERLVSTSTSTRSLYYLPQFSFPAGKTVLTDPPTCQGGPATIKIPYSGTTDYTVTVRGVTDFGYGQNPSLSDFPSETIDGVSYRKLSVNLAAGDYVLVIENKAGTGSPCAFDTDFKVLTVPSFTISNPAYPDKAGNYEITKNGGTGRVQFDVSGSYNQTITVKAGTKSFSKTLSSSSVTDGRTYYSGSVSIDLSAGTYNISVENAAGCTSDSLSNITMRQPDAITYTLKANDPKCYNGKGSIEISGISGGIGSYKYKTDSNAEQSFNADPITIDNLSSGSHRVTIEDDHGNSLEKTFTIASAPSAITITTTETQPTTFSGSDGTVTITASGGTPTYTYSKDNSIYQSSNILTGFTSGDKTIYVKDANGCASPFSIKIPEGRQITVETTTATAPTCNGGTDGKCVLVIGNRQGTLSADFGNYSITDNNIITFNGLSAGTYNITIRETYNGQSNSITAIFNIESKAAIVIDATVTPVSNKGTATGKITVGVSGGNGGTCRVVLLDEQNNQLQEQNTANTCTFENLAGAYASGGKPYRIKAYDSKDCTGETTVRVQEPETALELTAMLLTPVSCYGNSDAATGISASGGWGNYRYSRDSMTWNTTASFANLPAGAYKYYVKDTNGGIASATLTVDNPQPLAVTEQGITPVDCNGSASGAIRFLVSGGTPPYSLTPLTGTHGTTSENGNTYITVNGLPAGNYTFTLKDSHNCTLQADQATVSQPDRLTVSTSGLTQPACGRNNGSLTATASGGIAPWIYTLTVAGTNVAVQTMTADVAVRFEDIASGSYYIAVTDQNGCTAQSAPEIFNLYINPAIYSADVTAVACFGESNGKITATAQKGTAGIDYFELTKLQDNTALQSAAGIFENLIAGDYTLTVYDENGCQSEISYPVTVKEPELLTLTIDAIVPIAQKGAKEGQIVFRVQGGNDGAKTVRLKHVDSSVIDSLLAVNHFSNNFKVEAGEYFLEVTDSKNCTFSTSLLQVAEPDDSLRLIIREVKDAMCKSQTGSIEVEGAGGWGGYRFKRATDTYYSALNRFENLYPGSYLISVRDAMGATVERTVTVYEPQDSLKAEIADVTLPTCGNNGSISIRLSGGTPPYQLSGGNRTLSGLQPQTVEWAGLAAGSVLLHLLDANGCRFDLETELPETKLLTVEEPVLQYPQPGMSDGAIRAGIRGGTEPYACEWISLTSGVPGDEVQEQDGDLSVTELRNIPSGYYGLTVTDAGGCIAYRQVYLAAPGDYRFDLVETGNETFFEASDGYAVLHAGAVLTGYTVISPQQAVSTYSAGDATESFEVKNDTVYLKNLSPGQWFVSGKNASGEQAVIVFEIHPCPEFIFTATLTTPVSRLGDSDGKIRTEVSGGGGNNRFTWTDEAGMSCLSIDGEQNSILQNIPAGSYTAVVEDRYGNRLEKTVEVPEPEAALQLSIAEQQNQSCRDYTDAYVRLSATGGWGDYQFRHQSELYYNNGSSYANLTTGEQYFYLTDKLGVIDSVLVTITEPEYLRASVARVDSVKCRDAFDGKIRFDITGGTTPYSFREIDAPVWTPGSEATGLAAGYHTFVFTDGNGCEGKDTLNVYVPEPDSLLFKDIQVTHTTCQEDNGEIRVELQGGTRPYYYRWLDGNDTVIGSDSIITGLKQNGFYRLYVTDANGCTQYLEQLIAPSTLPRILQVETADVLCYGESNGTALVTAVEPATPYAPYILTWSNGDTGEFSNRFPKGRHSVTVSDENGCSTTYYFDIGQPDSLYLLVTDYKDPHCFGYSDGYIHTETHGGAESNTYLWSNGATTPNIDSVAKGDYWVRVTDGNGCSFEKHFTLSEPDYQSIDLGEDVLMCPGNTHVIDGGSYTSYRWFTDGNDRLSTSRYLSVTETGKYYLEARTPDGCPAWGDIEVFIGNNALQADLLVASEATVGDTLYVFEVSNLPTDSLKWEYDPSAFTPLPAEDVYDQPYVLLLQCNEAGFYNIGLQAFSGGCYSPAVKQVEIRVRSDEDEDADSDWGLSPMIRELKVYPNPSDGNFTVEVELREIADVHLTLFEVASGHIIHQRTEKDSDAYIVSYSLNRLNTGVYALIVSAGNERRQTKIIIK
jgi:hypothetical protein